MMSMLPGYSGVLCGFLIWLVIMVDIYVGCLASYSGRLFGFAGCLAVLKMLAIFYMLAEYAAWLSCFC
jgi:hypothetical protein